MQKYLRLISIIFILQILAYMTSFFVTENAVSTWYQDLNKSPLNPPDITFPIVWTILYALIGVSLWKIWENRHHAYGKITLALFAVQLFLNYTWSPIFFELQNYTLAFYSCIALVIAILANIFYAAKISKPAAAMLVPYMLWGCFATYLTYYVMTHN